MDSLAICLNSLKTVQAGLQNDAPLYWIRLPLKPEEEYSLGRRKKTKR